MFEETLRRFLASLANDAALDEFARKHRLSLHYFITDKALDFYMAFEESGVKAGFGAPPAEPDLVLKMEAATFEGIMSGQLNGTMAFMSGKIKLQGDMAKALALQTTIKDMVRLYTQARTGA
jgi:putative sterol carrier protein